MYFQLDKDKINLKMGLLDCHLKSLSTTPSPHKNILIDLHWSTSSPISAFNTVLLSLHFSSHEEVFSHSDRSACSAKLIQSHQTDHASTSLSFHYGERALLIHQKGLQKTQSQLCLKRIVWRWQGNINCAEMLCFLCHRGIRLWIAYLKV